MNTSFYTAARGTMSYQEKLNIVANNVANVNTNGYKTKNAVFQDLMYYNMHQPADADTRVKAGTGSIVDHTNTNFDAAGLSPSQGKYDCGISGEGFFMLRNPANNAITYTRDGAFRLSQRNDGFYLVNNANKLVLDQNQNPIRVLEEGVLPADPGLYTFANLNGMQSIGTNEFSPVAKNGPPLAAADARVVKGVLEMSNVDMAEEMSKTIETSRAYSYVLKMVQTSDEVEQTINNLRG